MSEYKFREIEKKWQQYWQQNQVFKTKEDPGKPKYYVLDMFPYPSGAGLHVLPVHKVDSVGHPAGSYKKSGSEAVLFKHWYHLGQMGFYRIVESEYNYGFFLLDSSWLTSPTK